MSRFNILYWNTNYRENYSTQEKSLKNSSKLVTTELDDTINKLESQNKDVDAIIIVEAYPLKYNQELVEYLEIKGYSVFPYTDGFNSLENISNSNTYKDEKTGKYIPFKRKTREIVYKTEKRQYIQNEYSNGVIVAVNSDYNFKIKDYKIDNPNCVVVENKNIFLVGTRICMGYPDLREELKMNLNAKTLNDIKLLHSEIGENHIIKNEEGFRFIDRKDYVNDYIIRRANFEWLKEKFNTYVETGKKVIIVGDFNISEDFKDYPVWNYKDIVQNDKNFKICSDNTIFKNKMDYIYTNCVITPGNFNVAKFIKNIYGNEKINELFNDIVNVKQPYPDHNLLFASIDLGD